MPDHSVDELRSQLRERGYLSHGIERWFALDPWSSRAFWLELATVALKAAVLIALFAAVPFVAVMLFRNHPLSPLETLELALLYGGAAFAVAFVFVVAVALVLKLRPELAVDTPSALLGISLAAAALLSAPIALWWYRFDAPPSLPELVTGLGLAVIFFLVTTTIVSAAILSFSIYELQRVPAIHQKPRTVPMTVAAAILMALLFLPAYAQQEKRAPEAPVQVVTTPTQRKVALVAVDGMTREIFLSRPELARSFVLSVPASGVPGESTAERWASVGTGVPTRQHGVRAIEGVRFRGGPHLLQTLSRSDFVIHQLAGMTGLARRQPLPPTVRRRDYVWELFAARGLPSAAVNWWTTETLRSGGLDSVGQETIFAAATKQASPADAAIAVDESAARTLLATIDRDHPQFATVYLPALDLVLNRSLLAPGPLPPPPRRPHHHRTRAPRPRLRGARDRPPRRWPARDRRDRLDGGPPLRSAPWRIRPRPHPLRPPRLPPLRGDARPGPNRQRPPRPHLRPPHLLHHDPEGKRGVLREPPLARLHPIGGRGREDRALLSSPARRRFHDEKSHSVSGRAAGGRDGRGADASDYVR